MQLINNNLVPLWHSIYLFLSLSVILLLTIKRAILTNHFFFNRIYRESEIIAFDLV